MNARLGDQIGKIANLHRPDGNGVFGVFMRVLFAALIPVLMGCSSGTFEKAGPFGSGTPNTAQQGDTDDTDDPDQGTGSTGTGDDAEASTGTPEPTAGEDCPVGTLGCPCEDMY